MISGGLAPYLNTIVENRTIKNNAQNIDSSREFTLTSTNYLNQTSSSSRFVVSIDDPYVGKTLKTFLIVKPIGKGAFGQVYLVDDQSNNNK